MRKKYTPVVDIGVKSVGWTENYNIFMDIGVASLNLFAVRLATGRIHIIYCSNSIPNTHVLKCRSILTS